MIYFLLSFLMCSLFGSEQSTTFTLRESGNFSFESLPNTDEVKAMAFIANDSQLMIAHRDKLTIFNREKNRNKYYLLPFECRYADLDTKENKLAALDYKAKGNDLYNRDLCIYDPVCQKIIFSYNTQGTSHSWQPVSWHPAGTMVVFSNVVDGRHCPHVIDLIGGQVIRKFDNPDTDLAHCKFSPDGNYLAGATIFDKSVIIWNMATGAIEKKITFADQTYDIYWSPDQKWLLVSKTFGAVAIEISDGAVYEKFSKTCINNNHGVFVDNARFLFSETSNMLELFNADTGKKRDIWRGKDNETIYKLALSENSNTLAVALYNQLAKSADIIKLFDVNK